MSLFEIFFIFVYLTNITLGISVFFTNNKRTVNQQYLAISIIVALWLSSNWFILHATTPTMATIFIKIATSIAILIPASCHILRLTILHPKKTWLAVIFKAKYLAIFCFIIIAFCFTPSFITSVKMPIGEASSPSVPEPIYGWGYFVFAISFIVFVFSLLFSFAKDRKHAEGVQRIELDFITIGYCAALITGTLCGILVTILTGSSQTVPIANASSILALTSIISYGIATRRILGITTILRRITAYFILIVYLIGIYMLVWHIAHFILTQLNISSTFPAQLLATFSVAFTMAPVHGKLQKVTDRLITSKSLNISDTMKQADNIFQSVTTQNSLLKHFAQLLQGALNSEHIIIFISSQTGFQHQYPKQKKETPDVLLKESALIGFIQDRKESICSDTLIRTRETDSKKQALQELTQYNANIAIGTFHKNNLTGVVLIGNRVDGRIYDKNEQDALQILCNQFAVALENAQLYTEMQDSKIRTEILLEQLISGVILASPERKIILINPEAQRIIGQPKNPALGQSLDVLPTSLSKALETTLTTQIGLQNTQTVLQNEEEQRTHIRMGSAYLRDHNNKPMGALLVFTDTTEVRNLEEQVRRADQLSSVGTLAAGMAHEIKNPLVTIKTFTQLLPDRHDDADFRQDFSELVAHEVNRIDGIVNQLLSFSKPTQPLLVPMRLHDTIEKTLKLIQEQLALKSITLTESLQAQHDLISGDPDLLTQTIVNMNLNAIDAIKSDGTITVSTTNCTYRFARGDNPADAITKPCIRLKISDTGKGIPSDHLQKIFDPFFTNKSEGTGMGLAVAHGIIQEHHGAIEVQSRIGKGTTFKIYIPILKEDS